MYGTFPILTCNERVVTFCIKLFLAIILLQCFISGAIAGIVLGVLLVIAVVVGISATIIVPVVVTRKKEVGENHCTIPVCEYLSRIYPKMSTRIEFSNFQVPFLLIVYLIFMDTLLTIYRTSTTLIFDHV